MAYAAISDMILRYSEAELLEVTTPPAQEWVAIDQVKVQAALDDATDEIDGYLRRRYQTPVQIIPAKLISVCCAIARFNLCETGYVIASEKIHDAHKAALSWLKRVSDGTVVLDGELPPNDSPDWARFQGRPDALGGYSRC